LSVGDGKIKNQIARLSRKCRMAIGRLPRRWLVWLENEVDNGRSNAAQHRLIRVLEKFPFPARGAAGDGRKLPMADER
jgi:hypothetical protein